MKFDDFSHYHNYEVAKRKSGYFYNLLKQEVKFPHQEQTTEDLFKLGKYYNHLLRPGKYYHTDIVPNERIGHLVKNVFKGSKILDAGCGFGTESLLCASLGAEVVGIDISDRIPTAQRRINYYERFFDKRLNVRFRKENLFNHIGKYDIIWVNEAISHISPLNIFLITCYHNLKSGGV